VKQPFDSDEFVAQPIRARLEADPDQPLPARTVDTSFEIDLDDPELTAKPVPVDQAVDEVQVRPIIPAHLRTVAGVKSSVGRHLRHAGRVGGYYAARSPLYVLLAAFWAVVGVFKLAGRQGRWWWQPDAVHLESEAANANDPLTWSKVRKEAQTRRAFRGWVLGGELVAIAAGAVAMWLLAPRWLVVLLVLVGVPVLARLGRPSGKPIIGSATVKPRFRRLNSDIVLRAYYAAGLGHPEKPDQQIEFGGPMHRDALDSGSQVVIDLPYGKTYADVVTAKSKLASGLDVTEYQVFLTRDRSSTRRHLLFVADRDPMSIPAGPSPLLDLKPRSIWRPFFCGLDERRRKVTLLLPWISVLVGAQPRKGKTFTARLFALYAALDPWTKLFVVDGKSSPDWRMFALVADRMVFGTAPTARDGDPIEKLLDLLRHIKKHIQRVNEIMSSLPAQMCPEGKLTEELARDRRYPELRVWMLVMEEFQVYFETDDQETNKEIAGLLSFIMSVGPSAGVILLSSSQKPSGVGAGDVGRLFNRFRDNHAVRIALKCGSDVVSRAVLGGDAYQEGYDASALPASPEYRGVGYVYGASDETPLTRFHKVEGPDAERILLAAREHRERLGQLSGEAAGDVVIEGEVVDPLTDALSVIATTEPNISWPRLAARLAEQLPDRWGDIDAAGISARLRGLGAKGKPVADKEFFPSGRGQGVARAELEQLAVRRGVSR
jgi:DNA segregation ATPase FtsK/SpoIIIE, S-DNA-T family